MTRTYALLLLAALASGCARGPDTSSSSTAGPPAADSTPARDPIPSASGPPRFEGTPPEVSLVVPARFDEALAADRAFVTLTGRDFGPEILGGSGGFAYPWSAREAPFAVIADFDGNGARDVALLQRSDKEGRAVVVLDVPPRPRVVHLRRWARSAAGDTGELSAFYLRLHPAGTIRVPDFGGSGAGDSTVTLVHEGIEVVAYGQAARTYWYDNGDFASIGTAD